MRPKPRRKAHPARLLVAVLPLAVVAIGVGVITSRVVGQGNGVPIGVQIGSLDLSGKRQDEVRPLLEQMIKDTQGANVTLRLPQESNIKRIWQATADELGLGVDITGTLDAITKACDLNFTDRLRNALFPPVEKRFSLKTTLDEVALKKRFRRIARLANREPKNPKLNISTSPYTILPGKVGYVLDQPAALSAINTAWTTYVQLPTNQKQGKIDVELPMHEEKPTVTEESLREIDGELGHYTTHFGGTGANRGSNIAVATAHIDGTLLAPNEVFSYNKIVGPRVASAGFKEAPVIIKGELVPGIGGGICQVSSTLYNAALLANLKIVRRSHHAFPVHYLPAGRDATVVDGAIDFQFQNSTDTPIYIRASSSGGILSFRILGKRATGRSVSIELADHTTIPAGSTTRKEPTLPLGKRIVKDRGHMGHKVTVFRVVRENGEVVKREVIGKDYYKPFPAIILEGTAPVAPAPPTTIPDATPSPAVTPNLSNTDTPERLPE